MPSVLSFIFNICRDESNQSAKKLQSCDKVVESPAPTHISDETESVVSLFLGKDSESIVCTPLRNRARLATFMTPNNNNEVLVSETLSSSFTTARFAIEVSPASKSFKPEKDSPFGIHSSRPKQMSTLPQTPKRSCIKTPTKSNHSKEKKQKIRWTSTPEGLKPRRSIEEMRYLFGFPELNSRGAHLQTLKKNNLSHQSYSSPSIPTIKEEENFHVITDTDRISPQRCFPSQTKTPNKSERLAPPSMENTSNKPEQLLSPSPPRLDCTASFQRSRKAKLPIQKSVKSNNATSPCLTVENAKTAVGRFVAQTELKKQMHFQCIDNSSIVTDGDATWSLDARYLSMSTMSLLPPGSSNKKKLRCKRKVDTRYSTHDWEKDTSVLSASYARLDDSQDHCSHAKHAVETSINHSECSSGQSDCEISESRTSQLEGSISKDWELYYERYKDEIYGDENDILTRGHRRETSSQLCDQTPQSYSSRHGLVDDNGRRGIIVPSGSYDFTPLESIEHHPHSPKPGSFVIRDENNSWISDISQTTSQGDELDHSLSFCDIAQRHRSFMGTSHHATMHHCIHQQSDKVTSGIPTLSKLDNSGITGPSYHRVGNHNNKGSGELCQVQNGDKFYGNTMIPNSNQSDLTGPSFHGLRGSYKRKQNQSLISEHKGTSMSTLIEQKANMSSDQNNIAHPTKKRSYSFDQKNKDNTAISDPSFYYDKKASVDQMNYTDPIDTRVNDCDFKASAGKNGEEKNQKIFQASESPSLTQGNESQTKSNEKSLHTRSLSSMKHDKNIHSEQGVEYTNVNALTEKDNSDTVQALQTKEIDCNYSGFLDSGDFSFHHNETRRNECLNNCKKEDPSRLVHVKEAMGMQLEESSMGKTPLPCIDDNHNVVDNCVHDECVLKCLSIDGRLGCVDVKELSKQDSASNGTKNEVITNASRAKIVNLRKSNGDNERERQSNHDQNNASLEDSDVTIGKSISYLEDNKNKIQSRILDVEESTIATMQVVMDLINSKESYQTEYIEQEQERDDISKQL